MKTKLLLTMFFALGAGNIFSQPMCNNDYACSSAKPLTINATCIPSSCSTNGATGPTTTVNAFCTATGNCTAQYLSTRWQDDVWFSITPSNNDPLTITVHPTSNLTGTGNTGFDPDVFVYTYNCVPATPTFTQQYCGCNGLVGQDEQMTFTPNAGTPYLIRVFSYGTATTNEGDFTICIVDPLMTGIEESTNETFMIYPNPSSGKFTIETKEQETEISIVNVVGEKILSLKMISDKSEIDLNEQPNGIYFLNIKTENGIANKKLIINK